MPWTKLTEGNDWGRRYVLIGERHMSKPYNTWGIENESGEDGTPILTAGKHRARFPDGHEEVVTVEMREFTTRGDMGHYYDVSGLDPVVVIEVHGVKVDADVVGLGIEIWRD